MKTDNHYVPKMYLRPFADHNGTIAVYGLLVPDRRVPRWTRQTLKAYGKREHLYVRLTSAGLDDGLETWIDKQIEAPAAPILGRVLAGRRLWTSDWKILIRFALAQHVRTPAYFVDSLQRNQRRLVKIIEDNQLRSRPGAKRIETFTPTGKPISNLTHPDFPLKIETFQGDTPDKGYLRVQAGVGRQHWHHEIKHLLSHTVESLYDSKWTIGIAPLDLPFFTSDSPLVKVRVDSDGHYEYRGGWKQIGTSLILPISPRHVLYTQVGRTRRQPYSELSYEETHSFRRLIAHNAYRSVIAKDVDRDIELLRDRHVNRHDYEVEQRQWADWNSDQSAAESTFHD